MDHAGRVRTASHGVAAPIEPQTGLVGGRTVAADALLPENRLHVAREVDPGRGLRDRGRAEAETDEDDLRDPAGSHLDRQLRTKRLSPEEQSIWPGSQRCDPGRNDVGVSLPPLRR
jgi:hypothetical protein